MASTWKTCRAARYSVSFQHAETYTNRTCCLFYSFSLFQLCISHFKVFVCLKLTKFDLLAAAFCSPSFRGHKESSLPLQLLMLLWRSDVFHCGLILINDTHWESQSHFWKILRYFEISYLTTDQLSLQIITRSSFCIVQLYCKLNLFLSLFSSFSFPCFVSILTLPHVSWLWWTPAIW